MTACDGGDGATTGTTNEPAGMPCGEGASRVELGSPHRGGPTAVFTTRGGTLYVTARRFESGGAFDPGPGRGVTLVFLGPADRPPTLDEQRGVVTNTLVELTVRQDQFMSFDLPAGRYWLWTSTGGDVVVASCTESALSDPAPVGRANR
jgi:hypothetical protein